MRIVLIVFTLSTLFSCNHEYNDSLELKAKYPKSSYPEQTLVGHFTSSTG